MTRDLSRAAAIALLLSLSSCGSSAAHRDEESTYADEGSSFGSGAQSEDESSPEFDEDAARTDAEQEVADEGYSGPCTQDCSGHDAGFAWAAEGHEDYGTSSSQSFDEGQEAYGEAVNERVEQKREEFDDSPEDSDYSQ